MSPPRVRWSGDSQKIYFQWKQASDPIDHPMDTYVVNRDGADLRKLTDEESKLAPPANGSETRDHKRMVYASDGDLFLFDFTTGTRHQLTKTADAESNPAFTQDEKRVAFMRGGNLYVMSLETGMIEQMTEIVAAGRLRGSSGRWRSRRTGWPRRRGSCEHRSRTARDGFSGIFEEAGKRAARNRARARESSRGK